MRSVAAWPVVSNEDEASMRRQRAFGLRATERANSHKVPAIWRSPIGSSGQS